MYLELRSPSRVGSDLTGKNVSVVYIEDSTSVENVFKASMADGFAYTLENEYGTGEGSIGVYRMSRTVGADYASKDTLVNLLLDTGADVVFLFDSAKLGEMSLGSVNRVASASSPDSAYVVTGSISYTLKMYSYDSMVKSDEVRNYGGTTVVQPSIYTGSKEMNEQTRKNLYASLDSEGFEAGEMVAASFAPQWKAESLTLTYYDSKAWMDALEKAYQFEWKTAMDIWFSLMDSTDAIKRACAAYNISVACYVAGDYRLAKEWLDLSDKDGDLPLSSGHRKRIEEKLK